MADSGLLVEQRGKTLLLTIDRESRSNSLDAATSDAIDREIGRAERAADISAVVLTGAGNRAFCSGMDIKEAATIGVGHGLIPDRGFAGITERRLSIPLIVAINGAAVAGGFEIALAADIVIAAEHATFGLAEVKRGLFAFAGGIQRLARAVPRATGLGMILTGEALPARRMLELGVITEVLASESVLDRALQLAEILAGFSREAIANARLLYNLSSDAPLHESLQFGRAFGEATLGSATSREGVLAFAEKRPANYQPPKIGAALD
jgi:enoyl-CoA hydratase/carnithine racemase